MTTYQWDTGTVPRNIVLREDLFAITQDTVQALVLGQLIYWAQRAKDFDEMLEEHLRDWSISAEIPPKRGWIYKTAEELCAEIFGIVSRRTVARALEELCNKGYLFRKGNEAFTWDRKYFYRVNFYKILTEINARGFKITDYLNTFRFPLDEASLGQDDPCIGQNGQRIGQNGQAIAIDYLTEITSNLINPQKENIKKKGVQAAGAASPELSSANSGCVVEDEESFKAFFTVEGREDHEARANPGSSTNPPTPPSSNGINSNAISPRARKEGAQADLFAAEKMPVETLRSFTDKKSIDEASPVYPNEENLPKTKEDDLAAKVREVYEYWLEVNPQFKRRRLTKERERKIRARLKTFTVEEMKLAIDGARWDPFYQGNNSRGQVYNRLETIFMNDTRTEQRIEYALRHLETQKKAANKSMLSKNGSRGKIGIVDDHRNVRVIRL